MAFAGVALKSAKSGRSIDGLTCNPRPGGVALIVLSDWCSFIVRDAGTAFANGAHLASILTAVAGIEIYLRSAHSQTGKERLVGLINLASMDDALRGDLHELRKYRNRWVHVDDPWGDKHLLEKPEDSDRELEHMALIAARALRRTIYNYQWV